MPFLYVCCLWLLNTTLVQIDEDVQRHNELIEMIKGTPSEISEIVSRCRKDLTKEFFVHLHTVAESYDNSKVENGEAKCFESFNWVFQSCFFN